MLYNYENLNPLTYQLVNENIFFKNTKTVYKQVWSVPKIF